MSPDLALLPANIAAAADALSDKIKFQSVCEKGGNGYVLIGLHRLLNRKVVVKFYYWGDGAHAEPRLLSALASDHVLQVHDAAAIDKDDAYFIAPFCEGGDLDDLLNKRRPGLRTALDLVLEVASGASSIHAKGYLHRDLKLSNIFSDADGKLVIGDFGSVVKKGKKGYAETSSKHSVIYRTPEEVLSKRYYEQGDVYQLGIVSYQLLGGHLPYDLSAWLSNEEKVCIGKLPSPDNEIYANGIIEALVIRGKVVDLSTLPPWCPKKLIAVVRKATKVRHTDRFETVAAFMTKLNNLRAAVPDWRLEPLPTLYKKKSKLRVMTSGAQVWIEKKVLGGAGWRKVHAAKPKSLADAIQLAENL